MTDEERKRYLGILIEDLYEHLQIIAESNRPDKEELAAKVIHDFYITHKDDYGIKGIKTITKELDRVKRNMEKDDGEICK